MHLPEFMLCYMAINKLRVMNKAEGSRIVGASSSPTHGATKQNYAGFPLTPTSFS